MGDGMTEPKTGLDALASFELPEIETVVDPHEDTFQSAVRIGFVGIGQAGGRLAETAWRLGWRRVCAINTAPGDLEQLKALPAERKLLAGDTGGAGKNPDVGLDLIHEARDAIFDLLHTSLGANVEVVLCASGSGGGSGSGAMIEKEGRQNIFDTVKRYTETLERPDPAYPRIGAIVTIPQTTEQPGVCRNAHRVLTTLFDKVDRGELTPLIVVDNNRIPKIWPNLSLTMKWEKPNLAVLSMLQAFTVLAATPADMAFDRRDLGTVLGSGTVMFGAMDVKDPSATKLSEAIRKNMERGMLAEGFDLSKAKLGAALAVGSADVLSKVKAQDVEYGIAALAEMMGRKGVTIHRGVYTGAAFSAALRVYALIGGLPTPVGRLNELAEKGG